LVLYQFGAELFYANANRFAEEVKAIVGTPPSQVRWLIVDAEAIIHMDYSAARMLVELHQELQDSGTQFGFARMHGGLESDFVRHQVAEVITPALIFRRLHQALSAFRKLNAISETAAEQNE
jgi:sulfate permease, SulP family